ncbi:hypothetical protein J437_LFUL005725 [Ladona fulva]|uniref:C2 domain-containing protein n=1 Tax=Ladona fulva TaxID=123851 RepID=A0A8K0JZX4_LADFU|nr:hypothetical protein J437_LFUL005725 [Ladona fulva]
MAEATAPRSVLASEVELTFSCRNLLDRDLFSLSDPMCVIYEKGPGETDWRVVHQTETLQDTLNPDFSNHLRLQYHFEEQQFLRFEIYDVDAGDEGGPLSKHDFLGAAETTLGKLKKLHEDFFEEAITPL